MWSLVTRPSPTAEAGAPAARLAARPEQALNRARAAARRRGNIAFTRSVRRVTGCEHGARERRAQADEVRRQRQRGGRGVGVARPHVLSSQATKATRPGRRSRGRRLNSMQRSITAFRQDAGGDWIADLECGHSQHVRHQPPFRIHPWVLDRERRTARIGTTLACPLCDRAELPVGLRLARTSPEWTAETMPQGLRRNHRLAAGTWGLIRVSGGTLRFAITGSDGSRRDLRAGDTQAIPPDLEHHVDAVEHVRFSIDFFTVGGEVEADGRHQDAATGDPSDEGGDPACWAGRVCPECGVVEDGSPHRLHCSRRVPV